jgi:hypothetical protein
LRSAPLRAPVIEPTRRSPSVNSHSMPETPGEPSARSVASVLWRPATNSRPGELRFCLLDRLPRRHGRRRLLGCPTGVSEQPGGHPHSPDRGQGKGWLTRH